VSRRRARQVSRSSCHNYYMNVTDFGYNLVVDLDTRTTSSQLFLLVKASPILRHSLEDEHNYASYYQFKKQGDHHGVVVTSEHLSPGRWYIGVCNYVQEVALFDDKRASSPHSAALPNDAAYTVVATLNRTQDKAETSQAEEHRPLDMEDRGFDRGFVSVDAGGKAASCDAAGGACPSDAKGKPQDGRLPEERDIATVRASQKGRRASNRAGAAAAALRGGAAGKLAEGQQRAADKGRKRAEAEEERLVGEIGAANAADVKGEERTETLFWAVRAESLEKELEKVREEMEIVKEELTGALSHNTPSAASAAELPPLAQPGVDDDELSADEGRGGSSSYTPGHPAASRRRRRLSTVPAVLVAWVPDTLLPGGELCDEVGICIGGVVVGLFMSAFVIALALFAIREREFARAEDKSCAHHRQRQQSDSAVHTSSAPTQPPASASIKAGKGKGSSKRASPEGKKEAHAPASVYAPRGKERASAGEEDDGSKGTQPLARAVSASSWRDVELLERRCQEMEEQLNLERQRRTADTAKEGPNAGDAHASGRFHAKEVEELMQALQAANQRVYDLETSSRRLKEDAEAAEARVERISREKAAAEKAAEVLEFLLSQGAPSVSGASAYSLEDPVADTSVLSMPAAAGGAGRRRPSALHADSVALPAPRTPLPTIPVALSNPTTPTLSHSGMAPIGTPSHSTHTPSSLGTPARHMGSGSHASSRLGTPARSLAGAMDGMDMCGSEGGWCTAPGTPMDGTAFAAFMGMNSSLDCSLPLGALEGDVSCSSFVGCGRGDCGSEHLCDACDRELGEGFSLDRIDGIGALGGGGGEGGVMAWSGARERDSDGVSSVGGNEESTTWPTRARGRRGGRRQKRVGAEAGASAGGGHAGAAGSGCDGPERGDVSNGADLATSMALAALGDD